MTLQSTVASKHTTCFSTHRFVEPLYGRFYLLHLCVHQFDEYWLANNGLALLLKHSNGLFLQLLSSNKLFTQPYRKHRHRISDLFL